MTKSKRNLTVIRKNLAKDDGQVNLDEMKKEFKSKSEREVSVFSKMISFPSETTFDSSFGNLWIWLIRGL